MGERYQTCVKRLKQQLETEQRLAAKMRSVSDRQFGEPSELEGFFLNCIEKVKSEIGGRRKVTAEYNKSMSAGGGKRAPPAPPASFEGTSKSKKRDMSVITIDDFTVVDRRKVVELLLSSEQVLQFLYDKLFPPGHVLPIQD